MPPLATESTTVQSPLVSYAGEIGWSVVPQSEAVSLRKGEGGMFFYNLLEETLLKLNPGVITPENVDHVYPNDTLLGVTRGDRPLMR